jgi:hypothetical protein
MDRTRNLLLAGALGLSLAAPAMAGESWDEYRELRQDRRGLRDEHRELRDDRRDLRYDRRRGNWDEVKDGRAELRTDRRETDHRSYQNHGYHRAAYDGFHR